MKIPEVLRIEIDNSAKHLATVLDFFGKRDLSIVGLQRVIKYQKTTLWELTVEIAEEHIQQVFEELNKIEFSKVVGRSDRVFSRHLGGKIAMVSTASIDTREELRDIYTPGVARVCLAINQKRSLAHKYTNINNSVAIVTNGTAILGLGDIGAVAGMPVMEGKAALFHKLAGVSGIPILIQDHSAEKIIDTVEAIAPTFGAIQLEDIAAPECFEIERELQKRLNIPVLHDDQHGTAVVVLAALLSATKQTGQSLKDTVVGQVGLGAAGLGIAKLLIAYGVAKVIGIDLSEDAVRRLEETGGHAAKDLPSLMKEADIIIATTGVKGLIKPEWVKKGHLILALTNPEPEIAPVVALEHGAVFAADGASVNNVLGFPGLFRGALDAQVSGVTNAMLIAAAKTIHENTPEGRLVPSPLYKEIHTKVAQSVKEAALS